MGRKVHCQGICCFGVLLHVAMADPAALLRYEPEVPASAAKESLDVAVLNTHQHTIVFEGNVLPGLHTVTSWPGKYESAWDTVVAGARHEELSAAVVFLPKGSRHYGHHDQIPAKELQDLEGCWCKLL